MTKKKGLIGRRHCNKTVANHTTIADLPAPSTRERETVDYMEDDVIEVDDDVDSEAALDMNRSVRIMICCMYQRDYNCEVSPIVVREIRQRCRLTKYYNVKKVVEEYIYHRALGLTYKGDRSVTEKLGRTSILKTDSTEAQIVADSIENGVSLTLTHMIVNNHRMEESKPAVTFAAVYGLVRRLKPKSQKLKVHRQGSCDVESPWARARFKWAVQLLIRYGVIDFDIATTAPAGFEVLQDYYDGSEPIPSYFDKTKLTKLDPHGIADWDEAHRACCPGEGLGNPKRLTRLVFPRDENGKIDLIGGSYTDEQVTMTRVKYNEEMRKAFGVAMVKPLDEHGNYKGVEGRRLLDFDYTGKTIKSIKEYEHIVSREVTRVKNLQGRSGGWVVNNRLDGKVYVNDPVTAIQGIGKQMSEKLKCDADIEFVHELMSLTEEAIIDIASRVNRLTANQLRGFVGWAQENIVDTNAPAEIDHRMASNPYQARYGETWREEIAKVAAVSPFVCVTSMVQHMFDETKRCFSDTEFKDNFMFYHDALSLMTDKDCVQWMRERDYLKHWILPEQDLFYDDKDLKRYRNRPVGNSPELNALDSSLNKDIHESVNGSISYTLDVAQGESKFSLRTPLEAAATYRKIFRDVAPTSRRIIQDRTNIVNSLKWIVYMIGTIVKDDDLRRDFDSGLPMKEVTSIRNGHRERAAGRAANGKSIRGGGGKRKLALNDYGQNRNVHPDAIKVARVKNEYSKSLCEGSTIDVGDIEFKPAVKAKIEKQLTMLSSSQPEE